MRRIVFLGSDAIALPALNWLAGAGVPGAEVVAVFTQPDRAAGRGQKIQPNEIKRWALSRGLPVFQPEKMGSPELAQLTELKPDLTLVMAYGHLLRQEVIDVPRLGTYNLHTSILPRYRGASPIQTAIASGEPVTGVTLMRLVLRLDAGPVADVARVAIGPLDTAEAVGAKLAQACVPLLARCLPAVAAGTQRFIIQDEAAATFCRRLDKADGGLDFTAPAAVIAARINGLTPWPGCSTVVDDETVRIGLADVGGPRPDAAVPGLVVGADADGLLVATSQGICRLRRLQRPGGRMLPAAEFLRGFPIPAGTVLPSQPMPALVATQPFPRAKSPGGA